jgi:hypothetical protein
MTSEQFIYWLAGYFTGGRDNDDAAVVEDIKEGLKKVKISASFIFFESHE